MNNKHQNRKVRKNRTGLFFWTAPVLLFCLTLAVFSFALLPYAQLAVSAASVYLVDSSKIVKTEKAEEGEYPSFGSEFGTIRIDKAGIYFPVFQGDSLDNLNKGVCHFYGSKMPGEGGTVVLSAHRTTHFSNLGVLQAGDTVNVDTTWGSYVYGVTGMEIIDPANESYLDDVGEEQLVLLTCYPFNFIGSAPQRYLVKCRLISGPAKQWFNTTEGGVS
ncbi:MAG: class D sortase [Eubacterium sp.]|nr:class D sortase [Eubacterium sp.]